MSNKDIPVIKFMFSSDFKVLTEVLNQSSTGEVENIQNATDLVTFVSTVDAALILTSLKDKSDLVQLATFMKNVKKMAQNTAYKIVVINFSQDKQIEKAIAKLGIQDVVEPTVNTKGLKFKMDFWMKSLIAQTKNNVEVQNKLKNIDQAKSIDKKNQDNLGPTWLEPLDLEDDIWLINHESDCKKILSKWLIRLVGPGPFLGQWVDVKPNVWRFDIKESEKEMFLPGSGAWFYFGMQKPEFVWKENIWLISGDTFDLFYKDGDQIYSRINLKNKKLSICKNSLYAKTKEQVIQESFDKEMVFKKEGGHLEDLEGKGKTDQLNGGPLSGNNKTSHLDHSPLSGDIDPEGQNLSSDPLSQGTRTSHEKNYWKGTNLYEKDTGGNSDNGVSPEAFHEGSELGLNGRNNKLDKYYKGHNSSELSEDSDEKNNENVQNKRNDGLSGKSSTDKLDGHYSNANHAQRENPTDSNGSRSGTAASNRKTQSRSDRDYPRPIDESEGSPESLEANEAGSSAKLNRYENEEISDAEIDQITAEANVLSRITQDTTQLSCSLDDYFDEVIIFTAKNGQIKDGKVLFEMIFNYLGKKSKLKLEGHVVTIEDDGEGQDYVTIQVDKSHLMEVESFMQLYQERQKNVHGFLERARGY